MDSARVSLAALLHVAMLVCVPIDGSALTGRILIAGYGPEQPLMEDLARAYEKHHPGTAIEFEWERTVRAVRMVREGDAQIAVTDHPDDLLTNVPVAWDGIAVIVNFANPLTGLTSDQVRGLFSGAITHWSAIDGGADRPVDVITRVARDNLTRGFEASLGLVGRTVAGTQARSDNQTLRLVSGRDAAISYISLRTALKAQEDGIPIRAVTIDHVEPGEPTVANGTYPLRRSVFLVTAKRPEALTDSFISFIQSSEGRALIQNMYVPVERSGAAQRPIAGTPPS